MIDGRMLHGGDYNPDQWVEYPGVFEEDIRLMKESHVNSVSLGIFSWAFMEPEEGVYNLGWLDHVLTRLEEEDITVVMATPSGALPHWLTTKYPETRQVSSARIMNMPGKRHNFCYTSPVMRQKIKAMIHEICKVTSKHSNVVLWHISNELGGNFGDSTCHCENCQKEFRNWLKKKYGTLEKLNHAWWNRFWSHVYSDWDQIESPSPQGENTSTALKLDWKRFSTEQIGKYCEDEMSVIKQYSDAPITTNFMFFFGGLDYQKLHSHFDVVSWDNYPFWHQTKDEVPAAVKTAANHNIMRSLKKAPFLLMESSPSAINWRDVNPLRRPGMHMLSSMQAVAHGSDSVQYFQWRKSRGSFEKFHGAVVDHKNGSNTRVFREVTELGKRLERLTSALDGTVNKAKVAVLFDWENWWAVEDTSGPRADINYTKTATAHYRPFWEAGIDVDFISMDDDLSCYDLVTAPLNYVYKEGFAERVRAYVANGGRFVTSYFSGLVDENDLCFLGHHPLEDVLGINEEELDAPTPDFPNHFYYKGVSYPAEFMCDLVHPLEGTEVISVYEEDFYQGMPVITKHAYGEGAAYYLCAQSNQAFLNEFYQDLMDELAIKNPLGVKLPYGVTVTERQGEQGSCVFVMNFKNEEVTMPVEGSWKNLDTDAVLEGTITLGKFECLVLKQM